jgi:polyisoprenoid-binding protein YceI
MTNQPEGLTAGAWPIDTAHSTISFIARHVMVTKVRGSFQEFSGTITVGATPLDSSVDVTVQMASVTTRDDNRDNHLRSADFFDVEKFPTMTFKSTSVKADGEDYKLLGDLTIHGTTQPVEFDVEFNGTSPDPWGGTRAGFSAIGEISRSDFGLTFNAPLDGGGVLVSDKIKIELEVQATKPTE